MHKIFDIQHIRVACFFKRPVYFLYKSQLVQLKSEQSLFLRGTTIEISLCLGTELVELAEAMTIDDFFEFSVMIMT